MSKLFSKKAKAIIGGALLATSLIAIPVFAATSTEGEQKPVSEAQSQSFMNYDKMQEIHNSGVMQEAMQNGDITKMQEAMNSPEMKEIMGEKVLEQMNKHMEENAEAMGQMMKGSNLEAMNEMMNGQNAKAMNQMMGQFQGNGSASQEMMGTTSIR